jgi:hypothetical protein
LLILKKEQSNEICRSYYPEPRAHLALFSVNWIFFVKRKSKILLNEHSVNKTMWENFQVTNYSGNRCYQDILNFIFYQKEVQIFSLIAYSTHTHSLSHTPSHMLVHLHMLSLSLSLSLSFLHTPSHTKKILAAVLNWVSLLTPSNHASLI